MKAKQRKRKKKVVRWSFSSPPSLITNTLALTANPSYSFPSPSSFPKVLLSSRALKDFFFAVNGWVRSLQVETGMREHCGTSVAPVSFSLQCGPRLICSAVSPEHLSSGQHWAVGHNLSPNHSSYGEFRRVKCQCVLHQIREVWKVSRDTAKRLCVCVLIT